MFKLQMDLYYRTGSEFTPTQYTQAHLQEKAIYIANKSYLECLVNLAVFMCLCLMCSSAPALLQLTKTQIKPFKIVSLK